MTVLIDPAIWPAHERLWCHLVSDSDYAELHVFAARLGVPERAFDRDHYDVPEQLRDRAVELGAQAVTGRELIRRLIGSGLRRPRHRMHSA